MIPVTINGRWTLQLPAHRAAQWENEWEAERLDSMAKILSPNLGEVVYYVGAEQGDMPALLASWGCDTVLIEPGPAVWANICAIYEANRLRNPLATFAGFAGAENVPLLGWLLTKNGWPNEAYGMMTEEHGFSNLCERPDIPVITLDHLAAEVAPPTAISIDVEGSELEVLRGAVDCLTLHRPVVWVSIHPEFMTRMYDQHPDEIFSLMIRHGYKGMLLADAHEEHYLFLPEEYSL